MLRIVPSSRFKKDLKIAIKRQYKIEALATVVDRLAAEMPLDRKYRRVFITA